VPENQTLPQEAQESRHGSDIVQSLSVYDHVISDSTQWQNYPHEKSETHVDSHRQQEKVEEELVDSRVHKKLLEKVGVPDSPHR